MSLFAKLAIATATTVTAGGGAALGIFSKFQTTSNSKTPLHLQELGAGLGVERAETQVNKHSDYPIIGRSEQADSPQVTVEVSTLSSHSPEKQLQSTLKQVTLAQNLKGEGNCEVEDGWKEKVIDHLPQETQYISVLCKNAGGSDSALTNWRGFLPEKLLARSIELFIKGSKFDIRVKEEELQDVVTEDLEAPTNQAVFSSEQFTTSVIGKWGGKIVSGVSDSDDPVYEVTLTGSESADKFYLHWLS